MTSPVLHWPGIFIKQAHECRGIKAEARKLSFKEQSELSRYLRGLALRNNPVWRKQVAAALNSPQWVSQVEMQQAIAELIRAGK